MESARITYEVDGVEHTDTLFWDHVPEWPTHVAKVRGPGRYKLIELDLGNGFIVRPHDENPLPFVQLKVPQRQDWIRMRIEDRLLEIRLIDGDLKVIVVTGGGATGCYVPFEGVV